jgi:hypothetical protein
MREPTQPQLTTGTDGQQNNGSPQRECRIARRCAKSRETSSALPLVSVAVGKTKRRRIDWSWDTTMPGTKETSV